MSFFRRLFTSTAISPAAMTAAKETAQKLIDENAVVVFAKSWCGYCHASRQLLDSLDVEYASLDLDKMSDGSEIQDALQELTGQRTVPNIFIKGKHIGGNSDLQALNKNKQLAPLLKEAGALKASI